jgi:hypothetical protein
MDWADEIAAGKASQSPPPITKQEETKEETIKPKTQIPTRTSSSAKRKLVGKESEASAPGSGSGGGTGKDGSKKKKKGDKKLLSFGDDE